MTKWLALLVTCLALGLVVAACGDDDDDDGGGGGAATTEETETTEAEEPAAGGGGGKTVEVSLKDIAFNPGSVSISAGDTVKWTNDESVPHDVTKESGPGPDFKSGEPGGMGQGDSYEETFTTAGKINYLCTVHASTMKGTITVK